MNILVTGACGQLGMEIGQVAAGSRDNYIFTDISAPSGTGTEYLDITDRAAVEKIVMDRDIKAVVNCAAYTDVDRAEDNRDAADLLNHLAPGNLASAMRRNGGLLVHISTDYVFGKEQYNTPCGEDRRGAPAGVYGETKLAGEQAVIASGCRYLIIRTSWLYSCHGRNFMKTMLDLTGSREEVKVVFDQTGTPTYAGDLAGAIYDILENRKYDGNEGIYHYSDEGVCSWYDFAMMIAGYSGHSGCRILPCHSSEYPSKAERPSYSVLDKTLIKKTFGLEIPHWTESLKRCLDKILQTWSIKQ